MNRQDDDVEVLVDGIIKKVPFCVLSYRALKEALGYDDDPEVSVLIKIIRDGRPEWAIVPSDKKAWRIGLILDDGMVFSQAITSEIEEHGLMNIVFAEAALADQEFEGDGGELIGGDDEEDWGIIPEEFR